MEKNAEARRVGKETLLERANRCVTSSRRGRGLLAAGHGAGG